MNIEVDLEMEYDLDDEIAKLDAELEQDQRDSASHLLLPAVPTTKLVVEMSSPSHESGRVAELELESAVCFEEKKTLFKMDAVAERKKRIEELKRKKAQLISKGNVQGTDESSTSTYLLFYPLDT